MLKPIEQIRTKYKAFTLAEVLITLGVIGVVAALTIPVLMSKNQENINRNKLIKAYSIINEATKRMQLDNGNALWPFSYAYADCVTMKNMYKPYLNAQDDGTIMLIQGYKMYKGSNHVSTSVASLKLPDGSILGFLSAPMAINSINGLTPNSLIYVDVQSGNGVKMFGVDMFVFELQKDKNDQLYIYPLGVQGDGGSCQINLPCSNFGNCPIAYGCTYPFMNGTTLP